DSEDAAVTLQDLLELSGHEVTVAFTGAAGLEIARRLQPEIVLCDIGLPGMDGYEVARALRRDPAGAGAYLIALSGYGQEEDLRGAHARQPGALDRVDPPGRRPREAALDDLGGGFGTRPEGHAWAVAGEPVERGVLGVDGPDHRLGVRVRPRHVGPEDPDRR